MAGPDSRFLEKNIELWSKRHPKEALFLPYIDSQGVECSTTGQKEKNLQNKEGGKKWYYHSSSGAAKEAEKWFASLNLEGVKVLYVYGVGLGYYYEAAKQWLRQSLQHYLIFLEDDIRVIKRLLETAKGSEILSDRQAYILYFKELTDTEAVFESLYWDFAMSPMVITALEAYKRHRKETFLKLQHKISYDNAVKNALLEEYLKCGGNFFLNYYQNLRLLPDSYLGNHMFGKYKNIPAIICGAGPSLALNRTLLGSLTDRAIIFAGGSALNALNAENIHPHFGAGIDPNSPQYDRLSSNIAFETPFFYRNRMFHNAFKLIHGPRLYITGTGGYDISDFFESSLGIKREELDEGHNVVNFCLEIAARMGCNPIIFAGMDLAYTGLKAYAPGINAKIKVKKNEILGAGDFDSKAIVQKDIFGKPVHTLWKWIAESEWISEFAKDHPEVTIVNATEGGLGFPGVQNITLQEAAEKYLQTSYDLRNRIHADIQDCRMPQVTSEKVEGLMASLRDSLSRCEKLLQGLITEGQVLAEKIKKEKKVPATLQTGRSALFEIDLAEEQGYRYVLDIFNAVQVRLMARKLNELKSAKNKAAETAKAQEKIKLNEKRLSFLRDVARVNISLINIALKHENVYA